MKKLATVLDLVMLGVSIWFMYETMQTMLSDELKMTRKLAQQQKCILVYRKLAEHFGREALAAEKRYYELIQR